MNIYCLLKMALEFLTDLTQRGGKGAFVGDYFYHL